MGASYARHKCWATQCLVLLGAILWLCLYNTSIASVAHAQEDEDDGGGQQSTPYLDPSYPQPATTSAASRWVSRDVWELAFPHRNDPQCPSAYFYEYDPFVAAVELYPDFGTTGDNDQQRREIASFFAHIAYQTRGGLSVSPDGPHAWGLCFKEETPCGQCCGDYQGFECAEGHNYCGRGPFQLKWNYRYGMVGNDLGFDGINQPELVEYDPVISFKTALWLWYWKNAPRPCLHDIHTGKWQASSEDYEANRASGFGLTINIINGLEECGRGTSTAQAQDRISFYHRMCDILQVDPGDNIDCEHQVPYT